MRFIIVFPPWLSCPIPHFYIISEITCPPISIANTDVVGVQLQAGEVEVGNCAEGYSIGSSTLTEITVRCLNNGTVEYPTTRCERKLFVFIFLRLKQFTMSTKKNVQCAVKHMIRYII